jgi:hypothetical protein
MRKRSLILLISLLIIVILGLTSKFYQGWQAEWFNNSLGGVFYVIFWMFLVYFFCKRLAVWKNAVLIFLSTSLVEFLQLWNPAWLQFLRSSFIGRTVLGTTFSCDDFFYYAIGTIIGFGLLTFIRTRE